MRSQLSFYRRVVCSLAVLLLLGHSVSLAATKFNFSGKVFDPDGKPMKKVTVTLSGEKSYKGKTNKKGFFKIKKVIGGEYSLKVLNSDDVLHKETLLVTKKINDFEIKIAAVSSETPAPSLDVASTSVPSGTRT